jgi:hypothetical protein
LTRYLFNYDPTGTSTGAGSPPAVGFTFTYVGTPPAFRFTRRPPIWAHDED